MTNDNTLPRKQPNSSSASPRSTHLERHPLAALLCKPGASQHAVAAGGPVAGAQLAAAQVDFECAAANLHTRLVVCSNGCSREHTIGGD